MRFSTLDSWRGISALLVVLYHAHSSGPIGSSGLIRGSFLFVDFFFVLSGFVMQEAYGSRISGMQGFRRFIIRRFARVWPLHAVILLAFVLLEGLKAFVHSRWGVAFANAPFSGSNEPGTILPNVLMIHALNVLPGLTWNAPSWSISAEFWTYLVFGLIALTVRQGRVAVEAITATLAYGVLVTNSTELMDTTYHLGFVRCLFGFFVGVICRRVLPRLRQGKVGIMTCVEVLSVLLVAMFVTTSHDTPMAFASPLIFAVPILVFAMGSGLVSRLLGGALPRALGAWSYSIYMTHLFVLGLGSMGYKLVQVLVSRLWRPELAIQLDLAVTAPLAQDLSSLGFVAIVVGASRMTYLWIEQPGQRWLGR